MDQKHPFHKIKLPNIRMKNILCLVNGVGIFVKNFQYMLNATITKQEAIEKAQAFFDEGYACSQSILLTFADQFELNHQIEEIYSTSNCGEILKKFASEADIDERKHHKIICRKIVGTVTEEVYKMINI